MMISKHLGKPPVQRDKIGIERARSDQKPVVEGHPEARNTPLKFNFENLAILIQGNLCQEGGENIK